MGSLLRTISLGMGHSFLPQIYFQKELEEKTVKSYGPNGGYWVHRLWISGHIQGKADEQIAALIKSFTFVSQKHLTE